MCGRYYRTGDKQAIADYFHADLAPELQLPGSPALAPEYNIPPTALEPILRQSRDTGRRELAAMRWGLVGFGSRGPDPKRATFNARVENLTRSTLWRNPLHKRRCLVPISGFYEWKKTAVAPLAVRTGFADHATPSARGGASRTPFRFTLENQPFFALAGLWDAWQSPTGDWLQSMTIITVEANPVMRDYHDRMPAILLPRDYDTWLDRAEVERPPTHLLRPYPGLDLKIHAAHPDVGNIRNTGIDMLNSQ